MCNKAGPGWSPWFNMVLCVAKAQGNDGEILNTWNPSLILEAKNKGRSITGFTEYLRRLAEKDGQRKLQSSLESVLTLSQVAQAFSRVDLSKVSDQELNKALMMFKAETVKLLYAICRALVEWRVAKSGSYLGVFYTRSLFGNGAPQPFDPLSPIHSSGGLMEQSKPSHTPMLLLSIVVER
eukprot:2833402-Amphidinium_carterae.2